MKKVVLAFCLIATHLGFAQMETAKTYAETIQEQDLKELLMFMLLIISRKRNRNPGSKKSRNLLTRILSK